MPSARTLPCPSLRPYAPTSATSALDLSPPSSAPTRRLSTGDVAQGKLPDTGSVLASSLTPPPSPIGLTASRLVSCRRVIQRLYEASEQDIIQIIIAS